MDYKSTLNMPNTAFEMKANLNQKEPVFQERWEQAQLYEAMLKKREGYPPFVLHDGPPYANGNIHIGHALNKILKDTVVRSRFLAGYYVPFIPGWDTHGLPIETALAKQGVNRKSMSVAQFRVLCEEYALKQIDIQMKDMKRLGTVADYDRPYITLKPEFEAEQIRVFAKMALSGMIYKGLKPVYWSPSSETALAEAEIEYMDKKDMAIYVAFNVLDDHEVVKKDDRFVIWTTTPWTIPANLAISVNPTMTYARVQTSKGVLVVLHELVESLMKEFDLEEYTILSTFKGVEVEHVLTQHPLYDRTSMVICGDHVSAEAGTGCVHTAPGHGNEDYIVGLKYGLTPYCPVDEQGRMMIEAGEWLVGQTTEEANKTVSVRLDEVGALLKHEWFTHSYPHDWRTKKPVIFRATTQWFASIDKISSKLLSEIEKTTFYPSWGQLRLHNIMKDRIDWCISRQHAWGVPIPILYTEDDTPILDEMVFEHVASLFEKHGSNIWFEKEASELLPAGYTHPSSPNNVFRKETDIMDVWFDSGSSHLGALKPRGLTTPVDLYLEGSDQYRGWFNSSLIVGVAAHDHAPYKAILTHGFVMDGQGKKMSKSLGNVVDPNKVTSTLGADILRLWVSSIDYTSDVRISDELLKQTAELYRKVRNTFRFMLGNLSLEDFTIKNKVALDTLTEVDKYVLNQAIKLNELGKKAYLEYDFNTLISELFVFMNNTLSAYYLDFTKDILYIEKKNSLRRRQVQTTLHEIVDMLVRLLAPILVHTSEEVWDTLGLSDESVHLSEFKSLEPLSTTLSDEEWETLFDIRSDVLKALEEAREAKVMGKSLQAHVTLQVNDEQKSLLTQAIGDEAKVAQWLIVSQLSFGEATQSYDVCGVTVALAQGDSCPRCWNVTPSVHEDHLCDRCHSILHD
ncbi:MAG: isoleucine--tRNA ligase [Erysipelotrichaceae bacterium]|nr:isoleucine--tRNA ligase [Erysipelotrichaceae bacterium]